jgi:hypothetical protein
MKNKFSLLSALLLASSLLVFTACDDSDDDISTGQIMVTHASPDAPGVDLLIDNEKKNSAPLPYPASTGYLEVETGTRNIKVNVAGTSTTVINADLDIEQNTYYSVFAVDSVANLTAIAFEDDLTAPASGKAHVRFIHLSPDAPAVDIAVASSGAVVFGDVSFKEGTAFAPLDAGTYALDVRVAGTQTVALVLPPITLSAGKIYTVFAKGFLAGTGDQALGAEIIVNK